MTKEEMTLALEDFKKSLPTYLTEEDLNKSLEVMTEKLEKLDMSTEVAEIKTAVEAQGIEMRKYQETKAEPKSINALLIENAEALKTAQSDTVTFKTDITRASLVDSTISQRLDGFGQIATQNNLLAPLFASGSIGAGMGGVVRYIDQTSVTNNAAAVAEGGVKPESAMAWAEKTMALQKIAHNIPVSEEALFDIPSLETEINTMLLKYLDIKVDNYLWSGTGSAPQIQGIYVAADEYVATASGITDANIYDLILTMKTNIAADTAYMPNVVIINPSDKTTFMSLKKDGNNNYVLPPFVELRNGQMYIDGMLVVASSSVTANTLLVGDFDMATLYTIGATTINIGRIDKQFVENMVTIQAERRIGLLVRSVHENAFNKETSISAALTTLAS